MDIVTDNLSALALVCAPMLLVMAGFVLTVESGVVAGLVLPGSSTVLLVGALIGSGRLPFVPSMVVLVLASTFGAQMGFATGRRRSSMSRAPHPGWVSRRIDPVRQRAQRVFALNAAAGTMLAHMVGGARTLGPRLASASTLSFGRFALLNTTAALLWVNGLLFVGAFAGTNPHLIPWLIAAIATAGSVWVVVRMHAHFRSRSAAAAV